MLAHQVFQGSEPGCLGDPACLAAELLHDLHTFIQPLLERKLQQEHASVFAKHASLCTGAEGLVGAGTGEVGRGLTEAGPGGQDSGFYSTCDGKLRHNKL